MYGNNQPQTRSARLQLCSRQSVEVLLMCITLMLGHANCSSHPQNGRPKSILCIGRLRLHLSSANLFADILLRYLA